MRRERRRGQAVVEFALTLPLYLLILCGGIEFGRALFAHAQLHQATQEGARYGAVLRRGDTDIRTRVQQLAPGGAATVVTIVSTVSATNTTVVAPADRARGHVLRVTSQHTQSVLMPFFPLSSFALSATVSMVIE
jgi:Flp pilus assembly protein TadG